MKAHQLIQAVGPELQTEIIAYLRNEQRGAYRAAIDTLATQKKLRPVFIKSKTKEQQATWLLDQMRIKSGDALAEQVRQVTQAVAACLSVPPERVHVQYAPEAPVRNVYFVEKR